MSENINSRGQRRKELEKQKKTKKISKTGWIRRIVVAIFIIGLAGLLFGGGLFAFYASSAPKLDEESLKDPITSVILDKNDDVFATIGSSEKRDYVNYKDIPKGMEDAILATEDVRFYKHNGIDFYRLGGAVLANITSGFGSQGASTITQQVIKNSFLQNEKTLKRKAQEAYLSYQLEKKYEKEEIFEMYFNKVLMSGNIYGFGTASNSFFGRDIKDLKLHEMALLAGMPQSPNNYHPFDDPEAAEKRRNIVLRLMEQHGKITKAEMEEQQAIPIAEGLLPEEKRQISKENKYDAYIDIVKKELAAKGEDDSLNYGIKIYTTLDPQAQVSVEEALASANFPTESMQAGMTVLDTKTGAIVAVGGGRNYENGTNYARQTDRSIGSTVKPILDYGPAIEYLDWSTGHTIVDEKMTYTGTDQQIRNFDGEYLGSMTIREALFRSRNIPAVKVFKEVDAGKRNEFANKLGFTGDSLDFEAAAIGGTYNKINTMKLAASYAAFGNAGIYSEPYTIREIVFRDGETKKTYKPKSTPAMKDSTAFMVTDMLRDVVSERSGSTGKAANISGLDVAGKTGTTNYDADEFNKYNLKDGSAPDVWFAGYTSNYSIAVWTGYHTRKDAIDTTNQNERTFAQRLFKNVMTSVSDGKNTASFKRPNSVIEATVEVGTSPLRLASEFTPASLKRTELFVRGSEPTQVSYEYEKVEVDAPTKLKADYSEGDQTATLSWDHKAPSKRGKKSNLDVAFEVSYAIDGGTPTVLQSTSQKGLIVTGIAPGSTYTFTVVAIADNIRSSPASTTLEIDAVEVPEPVEEEIPEEDKDVEKDKEKDKDKDKDKDKEAPPEEEPAPPAEEPTPPEEEPTPPVEEPTPPIEEPTPPEDGDDDSADEATAALSNRQNN
ncbi:penicillin-binding protein 1A [Paenisporosarcina sp. TG-14]|uniref:penicillin-binding protein 1A n=1 Tax=Paenisporosarcina sp. TG-14 TaxID=1231057 RepID=UPI0002FD44A4|nr:penicillin-binding protein 1A [Paenisporosarcina sp. TG-14]